MTPYAREEQKLKIARTEIYCVAKGYHECTFQVEIGERFVAMQKNSTKGRAFKILNDRGQLGHLERELVEPLWSFERLQW